MNPRAGIVVVLAWTVSLLMPAPQGARSESAREGAVRSIGPGRVSLSATATGQWTSLRTAWDGNESLITAGGVVVYATDESGRTVEVANTGRGDLVGTSPVLFRRAFEGVAGGFRAPSPRPDDDGDGSIDEDQLDGIDNDGDGRIDEDFAAIGDEMIVSAYRTPEGAAHVVAFHQEMYAWSLPHIEGAVMMSLTITNVGNRDIDDVRVAVYYSREGLLDVVRQPVGEAMMTCSQKDGGTNLLLVPFSKFGPGHPWNDGAVDRVDGASDALLERARGVHPDVGGAEIRVAANGATVYCMSPRLGKLMPGEDMRVDVGVIAVPSHVDIAEARDLALKTYSGDGEHPYLPPPVAIKPRVLWGYYRPLPSDERGVWLDFDVVGQANVDVSDFSHFSGMDANAIGRIDISPGQSVLAIRGAVGDGILRSGGRVTLKGRLESGEFFEANMRPHQEEASPELHGKAEVFWSIPGKLTQQLLKASPNPFRDATLIGYEIPSAIEQEDGSLLQFGGTYETTVKVYNVVGRQVATLVDRVLGPGDYSVDWPAVDDNGNPVASGVYYLKLQIENRFITQRLIFLK